MAMQRPVSERILPNAGHFAPKRGLKRLGEKKAELNRGEVGRKDPRKFRIVAGGGAYGLRRVLEAPPLNSSSCRAPTPDLIPLTHSQSSVRANTSRSRLVLRRKPIHLPITRRPLKRQFSAQALSQRKAGFSAEYLRELGNMFRLQVRAGEESASTSGLRISITSGHPRDPN